VTTTTSSTANDPRFYPSDTTHSEVSMAVTWLCRDRVLVLISTRQVHVSPSQPIRSFLQCNDAH